VQNKVLETLITKDTNPS